MGLKMTNQASYTEYNPKSYHRPVSIWWWLDSWRYTRFVLRELTSVPVAFVAGILLWQVVSIAEGPAAYASFLDSMRSPLFMALHVIAITGTLFHALTWFHLAPKAMVVRMGGRQVPDSFIILSNYAGWVAASVFVGWFWLVS